jgi:hypothetical protein
VLQIAGDHPKWQRRCLVFSLPLFEFLGNFRILSYNGAVHNLLRFLTLLNTAIWIGTGVFFTFLVGPAFFSQEVAAFLPRPYVERLAEIMINRYYLLFLCCAIVSVVLVIADYLHAGRLPSAGSLVVLLLLLGVAIASQFWLEPKLNALHRTKYSSGSTAEQKLEAQQSFRRFHGLSQGGNLVGLIALGFYFWGVSRPSFSPRYSASQLRNSRIDRV